MTIEQLPDLPSPAPAGLEHGTIVREIHVEADVDLVFEVVSSPNHLEQWWPDHVDLDPRPGSSGTFTFGEPGAPDAQVPAVTVVAADPPRSFSFRWIHSPGQTAHEHNSLLVTFELFPAGSGTLLRMTETGFRLQGWEVAVLEEQYRDHCSGWDHFIPRLGEYVSRLVAA
jgi:uncharacterized protein YndB with AHSA1/START domain